MESQQFPYEPQRLFGTSRFGSTTAEIDDEVSRWLETHHPIEIFDKKVRYPPTSYYTSKTEKYGTMREVLNNLPLNDFSYSKVMQKYANLLAANQPVSVEPIEFFINCLQRIQDYEIRSAQSADQIISTLFMSGCEEPGLNQVMSEYIKFLQTQIIEFMLRYHDVSRDHAKIILQSRFIHLIIPFLKELTYLNRNQLGNDFIKSKLSSHRMDDDSHTLVNFIYFDKNYNKIRELLMKKYREPGEAARAGIEDILSLVDRDVQARAAERELARAAERELTRTLGQDVSHESSRPSFLSAEEDKKQFERQTRKSFATGGKRTKKRKQKRSTNKKRRLHKKHGRMSKRR
jgi:hypothetical protein